MREKSYGIITETLMNRLVDNMLKIGMKDNEIKHDLILMLKYQAKEEMELIIEKIESKKIKTPKQEYKFMKEIMKKYCKLYQKN